MLSRSTSTYFLDIDPASVLQPSQAVPSGNPNIVHSAATTQDFKDLTPGSHKIWVVMGDVAHVPCSPLVVATTTITVSAAVSAAPATGTGGRMDGNPSALPWFAAILITGLLSIAGGGLVRLRRAVRTP